MGMPAINALGGLRRIASELLDSYLLGFPCTSLEVQMQFYVDHLKHCISAPKFGESMVQF